MCCSTGISKALKTCSINFVFFYIQKSTYSFKVTLTVLNNIYFFFIAYIIFSFFDTYALTNINLFAICAGILEETSTAFTWSRWRARLSTWVLSTFHFCEVRQLLFFIKALNRSKFIILNLLILFILLFLIITIAFKIIVDHPALILKIDFCRFVLS